MSGRSVGVCFPKYVLYEMDILPLLAARLVVTRITPADARDPYIAEEAASFNTEIDSIMAGSMLLMLPSTPSIKIRGLELPRVVFPRILMVPPSRPG